LCHVAVGVRLEPVYRAVGGALLKGVDRVLVAAPERPLGLRAVPRDLPKGHVAALLQLADALSTVCLGVLPS
jgi:hypothetical protein